MGVSRNSVERNKNICEEMRQQSIAIVQMGNRGIGMSDITMEIKIDHVHQNGP